MNKKVENIISVFIVSILILSGILNYVLFEEYKSMVVLKDYYKNSVPSIENVARNTINKNIIQCNNVVNKIKEGYEANIQKMSNNHASEMLKIWSSAKVDEKNSEKCRKEYGEMRKMYNFCVKKYEKCRKTEPL